MPAARRMRMDNGRAVHEADDQPEGRILNALMSVAMSR